MFIFFCFFFAGLALVELDVMEIVLESPDETPMLLQF
jgi:hypothetical protein